MREIDINSNDNTLFVTSQCNNRCLMCSQPPLNNDDIEFYFSKNWKIVSSAPKELTDIGITGGEPTLLRTRLFDLLQYVHECLPHTLIHILTNGRSFADKNFAEKLSGCNYSNLLLGIPIHSDYSGDHDYITQIQGAYSETLKGLYNLAIVKIPIELRIVINKINYLRLPKISNFIYKNLPFVDYISFMGLEDTGYSVKNHSQVWIDPVLYQDQLEEAVLNLAGWGMNVSIFNLPHCLLKTTLYEYACKSISDWKTKYIPLCNSCKERNNCCGLFSTSRQQSSYIHAI